MKKRIGGLTYLVCVAGIYLIAGLSNIHYEFVPGEYLSMVYVLVLSLPLWIPGMDRFVSVDPIWKILRR